MEYPSLFSDIDTSANEKSKDLFMKTPRGRSITKSISQTIRDEKKAEERRERARKRRLEKQRQADAEWEKRGYHQTELFCGKKRLDTIIENVINKFLKTL